MIIDGNRRRWNEKELFREYPLLQKCTPETISFDRDVYGGIGESFYIPKNGDKAEIFRCTINPGLSEYEQTLTVLHELYHDYPGFRDEDYKEGSIEEFDRKREEGIEKMAQGIMRKDTRIKEFLVKQIRLSKVKLIKESINEEHILKQRRIKNISRAITNAVFGDNKIWHT